ncbi:hypothetical protein ACTJKO_07700 [Curtobacterium sp. 22159]|uniref:hypothetical protein n=1 Tax=Curtobacterium sp. 22159 TaxID=3453882 RepID=UPI003F86F026
MAGLNFGSDFNDALVALAGWDPATVDPSTVDVPFVNLTGDETTIRVTATANVATADLKALLTEYAKPTEDPTVPDLTATSTDTATPAS